MRHRIVLVIFISLALVLALVPTFATALECAKASLLADGSGIGSPCGSRVLRGSDAPALRSPHRLVSQGGHLRVTLEVRQERVLADVMDFTTRLFCLSLGHSEHSEPECSLPGPTLVLSPGDTLTLTLRNRLPLNTSTPKTGSGHHMRKRHLPGMANHFANHDLINVHTHGLHVDPFIDDVLLTLRPGEEHTYLYKISLDHSPGLAWYHAHVHGSATLHLLQGLLGAVEIAPVSATFLPASLTSLPSTLLVLTHHPFCSCNPSSNMFKIISIPDIQVMSKDPLDSAVHLGSDSISDAYLVNGQWQPRLETLALGQWHVLNLVNAVPDTFLELELSATPFAPSPSSSSCRLRLLALDGVYLSQPRDIPYLLMTSGGRASIAFSCSLPGTYYLHSNPQSRSGAHDVNFEQNLLTIHVDQPAPPLEPLEPVQPVEPQWRVGDIPKPLYLQDLFDAEVSSPFEFGMFDQNVVNGSHWLGIGKNCSSPCVSGTDCSKLDPNQHGECNYMAYQGPGEPLRRVASLCSVEQVTMRARGRTGHPMHIHTLHFQIVSAQGENGDQVAEAYARWGKLGDWRDTFPALPGVVLVLRYALDSFGGALIVHCHTSAHEDGGMMGLLFVDREETGLDCVVSGGGGTGHALLYCDCQTYESFSHHPATIAKRCPSYHKARTSHDSSDAVLSAMPLDLNLPLASLLLLALACALYFFVKRKNRAQQALV